MRLCLDHGNVSNTGEVRQLCPLALFVLDICHHPRPSLYTVCTLVW